MNTKLLLALVALSGGSLSAAELIYQNDFETGDLARLTVSGNAPAVVGAPVAHGRFAADFSLTRERKVPYRTEVVLSDDGKFDWDTEYWIGFNFRFEEWATDRDMEIAPFQIHPTPSSWDPKCGLGSQISTGPVMMAVQNDELRVYTYGGVIRWRAPVERKKWQHVALRFIPSKGGAGLIEMWKDGAKIVSVEGRNSPDVDKCGQPLRPPYWKMGVYKWNWKTDRPATDSTQRQLLIDDFKIAKGANGLALVSPHAPAADSAAAPVPRTVFVDDASERVVYQGPWRAKTGEPRNFAGTEHFCRAPGASVEFTFTGTSVQWLGKRGNHYSHADVFLDGELRRSVDCYMDVLPPRFFQQVNFSKSGLPNTTHTLKIVLTDRKNPRSSDKFQVVDAFIYTTDDAPPPNAPPGRGFRRVVLDPAAETNAHKAKVFARFSADGGSDVGAATLGGFTLYRHTENWKAYHVFTLPQPAGAFEDASVADINRDGWNDIVLGGWGNLTVWAENPAGRGQDPYTTAWTLHPIDDKRCSHEVCAADLNRDGKSDVATTSGLYFQGATSTEWTFVPIERGGQGTAIADMLHNGDGYNDVVALHTKTGRIQLAWFENPGHAGGDPLIGTWTPRIIDANPGGDACNFEMTCMAVTVGDVNGDGRPDLVAASQGEGPGPGDDDRQIGDGLVWYEAPVDPRSGTWKKHVIDPTVAWVHAASIQLADFDGDGALDINYAEQDQSRMRHDGCPLRQRLGIFYNVRRDASAWEHQLLSRYPEAGAGGFNTKLGAVDRDARPALFTSLHGYFKDDNPLVLWQSE